MIERFLNQSAIWRHVIDRDGHAQPVHDSDVVIRVRWEGKRRLVRDRRGQEVVSEARMFCLEPVQPGDEIEYAGRRWTAIAVSEMAGLDGEVLYREVVL
ncbi:MAG: hypothetical protein ACM3ZU_07985 [Bacteroidota bacterium]